MTIIDSAVYVEGVRRAGPQSLEQTFETLTLHGGMAWIGLYRPTESAMASPRCGAGWSSARTP